MIFGNKKRFDSDLDLLESQSHYKEPLIRHILSASFFELVLKLFGAYVVSLIMVAFGLFENFAFFIAFFMLEIILYNMSEKELSP